MSLSQGKPIFPIRRFFVRLKTMNSDSIAEILAPFWRTDDGGTASERAADFGIDLSLIEENLRLTPEQRIDQNQSALDLVTSLQEARD